MSKRNYSKYSEKNNKTNEETIEVVEPVETPAEPEVIVENTTPEIELVEETVETVTLPETVTGTVINCAKLNVREKPTATAAVVCVLDASSEIEINVPRSTTDWVKVCTATGIEGYCMRKFVDASL